MKEREYSEKEVKTIDSKIKELFKVFDKSGIDKADILLSIVTSFFITSVMELSEKKKEEETFEAMCSYMHDIYVTHNKVKNNRLLETERENIERMKRAVNFMINYMTKVSLNMEDDMPIICKNFIIKFTDTFFGEESRMKFIEVFSQDLKDHYQKLEKRVEL